MFSRILVANRGEIAVRVIRAAREFSCTTVAIFSDEDRDAPFVKLADIAIHLPGKTVAETYLNQTEIIKVALANQVQAIHPGYGFLSENSSFAAAVEEAGITWIGPSSEVIEILGNKISAKSVAQAAGAPLAPARPEPVSTADEVIEFGHKAGYPVVIKAAMGGGGRGMKVVSSDTEAADHLESARKEARMGFGDDTCFVEKYLDAPRHIEVQILGDNFGNVVAVGTRDCSLQRRHQKLVEEAPAPYLSDSLESNLLTAAEDICRHVGYSGAGTVEFLVAKDETVTFLEVNTRLQVEHCVTEAAYDVDLVQEQFRIAAGKKLSFSERPRPKRCAIEFRINAEDVRSGFLPDSGTVSELELPTGPGIRVDSGIRTGSTVTSNFDSLLLKLVVSASDRANTIARARMALDELKIEGVDTTIPFARWILTEPDFLAPSGIFAVYTTWIDTRMDSIIRSVPETTKFVSTEEPSPDHREIDFFVNGKKVLIQIPNSLDASGSAFNSFPATPSRRIPGSEKNQRSVISPMTATVISIDVSTGDVVSVGTKLGTIEAMKMEHVIFADATGVIDQVLASEGATVKKGEALVLLK